MPIVLGSLHAAGGAFVDALGDALHDRRRKQDIEHHNHLIAQLPRVKVIALQQDLEFGSLADKVS